MLLGWRWWEIIVLPKVSALDHQPVFDGQQSVFNGDSVVLTVRVVEMVGQVVVSWRHLKTNPKIRSDEF
jgi:hypothetical protein